MFVLAPSLMTSTNSSSKPLTNQAPVESNLLAQFAEETLRVAVYAEDNTSLPAYATGGVYTADYQNVIDILVSAGYDVTALSTQDIIDRKLKIADYDAFVLPNQLPRESIIDHIKDYWLGGGGILCFDAAVGYLFYAGIIDPSYEYEFNLYPMDPDGDWTYAASSGVGDPYDGIYLNQRNPVTKSLEEDTIYPYTGNQTLLAGFSLLPLLSEKYLELGYYYDEPTWTSIAGFDNPDRGGKMVYLTGNCSSFETWMEPIIADAIDWVAPRPKARIAIDFTHKPYYGVDLWDMNVSFKPRYNIFRNFLVNHSFTFDKLYPVGSASLTTSDIAPYDILMLNVPSINYTATEISMLKNWVQDGGSLFILGDWITQTGQQNLNLLMADWGLSLDQEATNMGSFSTSEFELHPVIEGITSVYIGGGRWVNVSGSAYPIINSGANIAIGGVESGNGRVILAGDINFLDYNNIDQDDNAQFGINIMNWLSASTAKVLVYADANSNINHPNRIPLKGPVALALNDLRADYYLTSDPFYFNLSLFRDDWEMIVFDNTQISTDAYQPHLIDFVSGGGKLIFATWYFEPEVGDYFGVEEANYIGDPISFSITSPTHPIFNLPVNYGAATVNTTLDLGFGTDAINLTTYDNATSLAGYTGFAGSSIAIGVEGRVLVNGPLLTIYNEDTDNSTYSDNLELWENQIGYLYFERPTINNPADVTYMETETGNEITWLPTADAGPWLYVVRENGSIIESGRWYGGSISINVDGIAASLTDYELTVFDRLGYSTSDLVVLNVTQYIAPPTTTTTTTTTTTSTSTTTSNNTSTPTTSDGGGTPLDPTILLIVGAAGVIVIIIVIILIKKK